MSIERLGVLTVANESIHAVIHDSGGLVREYDKDIVPSCVCAIEHFCIALGIACGFTTLNPNQQASQTWLYSSKSNIQ